jgi:translation initiation factor 3 subunit E
MICPHLIRYLAASILLSKNSQKYGNFNLNSFLNLLQRETCEYSDSLIEFIKMVLLNFDFKKAQSLIKDIRNDFQHDFFLSYKVDAIVHCAQTVLFEEYCKIHNVVEIRYIFITQ